MLRYGVCTDSGAKSPESKMSVKHSELYSFLLAVLLMGSLTCISQAATPGLLLTEESSDTALPERARTRPPVSGLSDTGNGARASFGSIVQSGDRTGINRAAQQAGAQPGWQASMQRELGEREYHATPAAATRLREARNAGVIDSTHLALPEDGSVLQSPNRAHDLRTYYLNDRIAVLPRVGEQADWVLTLKTSGIGRSAEPLTTLPAAAPSSEGNRVRYRRGTVEEWYVNSAAGVEQGWTLSERPLGEGPLEIRIAVDGLVADVGDSEVRFRGTGAGAASAIHYDKLVAFDASGADLPARLEATAGGFRIVVDDRDARYPVVIDPLMTTPAWQAQSDQEDASFGNSVAGAGDVNGDGFADVIVGASGFDNGEADEGAAFVYYGSASGLSTTPAWRAEGDQVNSGFGISVTGAGDVNGDGFADLIVGAPRFDNGEFDEGAAFVYFGSASGPSTAADWQGESNKARAEFGTSVAGAGDVNGDGYADMIIGARVFDNGENDEGAAFVYFGSASGPSIAADWQAESNKADTEFGSSVAGAGDVNGDGYADVIVGAPKFDNNGASNKGAAFVYFGSDSGLAATAAWQAEGDDPFDRFGTSVAGAGDVNGDGYADVIVGARNFDTDQSLEGAAFVYFGSASGLSTTVDWQAEGDQVSASFGISVAGAGDVNGDGFADVIVGAVFFDNGQDDEGAAFMYLGSASGLGTAPAWQAESDQDAARFGASVAGAGDVNGDGFADVIVGARLFDNGEANEGAAFGYLGAASGLVTTAAWQAESEQDFAGFGDAVAAAGDVNGDGFADLIVGAPRFDNGEIDEGAAFVFLGSAPGLSTAADWQAESDQEFANFGSSVAGAGDVNGDGYADVIVGAPFFDNGEGVEGAAFVYYGSGSGLSTMPVWRAESDQAGARFGISVAGAGDVNGDGHADVIVGAPKFDSGQANEGAAFVYFGSASGLSTKADWQAESDQEDAAFGASVAGAGDVNGDGHADVIVGTPKFDSGQANEGAAFVYFGSASGLSTTTDWQAESDQDNADFGISVAGAADVNGDGFSDVIVGASGFDNGETNEGAAFVFLGSASGLLTDADWQAESDQESANFGSSVAGAGDVNGDGYADVIVGAFLFDNGEADEGAAFVYMGSASGLGTTADWQAESDQDDAWFGFSVAGAGDVNGDGYADVSVGAIDFDNGQTREGAAFVYLGNEGRSRVALARQFQIDATTPIAPGGLVPDGDFVVSIFAPVHVGRTLAGIAVEVKSAGVPFDGQNLVTAVPELVFQDSTTGQARYDATIDLQTAGAWRWRARVLSDPTTTVTSGIGNWGRWLQPARAASQSADVRFATFFSVGGMVSGLQSSGLVLNNEGSDLSIADNGSFIFPAQVDGSDYAVTVSAQPSGPSQTCTVSNGAGTLAGANVTDVQVTCMTDDFTVGGTVSGLAGTGLVLRNNAGDDLPVSGDGAFSFPTALADGSTYAVSVATQPTELSQTCTVTSGAGTLAGANVTDVQVTCVTDDFTVGGTVSGLAGTGLVLRNNAGDDLPVSGDGAFTFPTALADGSTYAVTVRTQPTDPRQVCAVTNATGQISGSDVTAIEVDCITGYSVGGTVSGLRATGLVLDLNNRSALLFEQDSDFVFDLSLTTGQTWSVRILFEPDVHTCAISPESGLIGSTNVTDVAVSCITDILLSDSFENLAEEPIRVD